MIIDCISDLHGFYPELQGGDLLIVAGDLTARDTFKEYMEFNKWMCKQDYKKIIWIGGNHDGLVEKKEFDPIHEWVMDEDMNRFNSVEYLCNSGTEFEGLKIWGSPYTPTFLNWHFMADRGSDIKKHWDLIPDDIDILVTHGPPYGILDEVERVTKWGTKKFNVGCEELSKALVRVRPKLHVFGHIHEGYGMYRPNLGFVDCPGYPIFVNASHVNENYEPVNAPIRIIL